MIQFCVGNGNHAFDHSDIYGDYTTERNFWKRVDKKWGFKEPTFS